MNLQDLGLGLGLVVGVAILPVSWADQPIFNEMPRWDNGWGFQLIEEYRHDSDLMSGDAVVAEGYSEDVHQLHIEGVYTWDKSVRITAKLPVVMDARRELPSELGGKLIQRDEGIGDATIALPLKRYFNLDGRSGSWTLTPQFRIPLSGKDEYEIYDGEWGHGVSAGYETETHRYIFAVGASSWIFGGNDPFQASANLDLGLNISPFGIYGHIKWETDFIYEDDGTEKLYVGPKLYLKIKDMVHIQALYKTEIHSRRNVLDHGNSSFASFGIAFVY